MTPEQIKETKANVENLKAEAIKFINSIEVKEDGSVSGLFALFALPNGQPSNLPISTGLNSDLFSVLADDFKKFLKIKEQEATIHNISDERLRARLLKNLQEKMM